MTYDVSDDLNWNIRIASAESGIQRDSTGNGNVGIL